jgi:hypothetical protein
MFEATKKLIEHCKHLPQMFRIFSDPLVDLAEKEIALIERQLTPLAPDAATEPYFDDSLPEEYIEGVIYHKNRRSGKA